MHTLIAAVMLSLSGMMVADSSGDNFQTSNGYKYTAADARQAINGFHRVFTDHSFTLLTEMSTQREMPAWDPVAHYMGSRRLPNGEIGYVVWLNERYKPAMGDLKAADPVVAAQIMSAMLMAAMDGGLAGPKWKIMYADATRRDRSLGPTVPDRYQNRHALVALLARDRSAYGFSTQPEGIVGLTGTPLTTPIHYATGLVGFAQAGVGAARITELLDDQRTLAEPDAQRFIDDWFSHLGAMLPTESTRSFLNQQRSLLVVDGSFDRVRNSQAFVQAMQTVANRLSSDETGAILMGLYAEQAGYNASLTQQANLDSLFRSAIAQDAALDGSMPKLAGMRQRLSDFSAGDWKNIQKQSAAIVSYILSVH